MPKFTFECEFCATRFSRTLKMGVHKTHPCPSCKAPAARFWPGQGFGFDFAATEGTSSGNSGVAKHDYPTADQAVGRSADSRWQEMAARGEVKDKVREVGGSRALIRRTGKDSIEYEAGTDATIARRKALVKEANAAYQSQEADSR